MLWLEVEEARRFMVVAKEDVRFACVCECEIGMRSDGSRRLAVATSEVNSAEGKKTAA